MNDKYIVSLKLFIIISFKLHTVSYIHFKIIIWAELPQRIFLISISVLSNAIIWFEWWRCHERLLIFVCSAAVPGQSFLVKLDDNLYTKQQKFIFGNILWFVHKWRHSIFYTFWTPSTPIVSFWSLRPQWGRQKISDSSLKDSDVIHGRSLRYLRLN